MHSLLFFPSISFHFICHVFVKLMMCREKNDVNFFFTRPSTRVGFVKSFKHEILNDHA